MADLLKTAFDVAGGLAVNDLQILTAMKTAAIDGWYMPISLGLDLEKRLMEKVKSNN